MTINELKNVIRRFKDNETNEEIFWGKNSNFKLYRTIFEGNEIKELKEKVMDTIEFALENRSISNYDLDCSFDETIEMFPAVDVKNYDLVNERISENCIENIDRNTNIENLNFIVLRLSIPDEERNKNITIIKKFNKPQTVLRQAIRFVWLGDRMKKVEQDVIYLDNQVDAFEYDGNFFILNRDKFNSIFKFRDMYCRLIDNKSDFIVETGFIDKPEEFMNKCKMNGHYVKKISKAILKKGFENIRNNKDKVKEVIENHRLGINVGENGMIIYEEEKIEQILNLLLDHYVIRELSDKRAIAKALAYEGEE